MSSENYIIHDQHAVHFLTFTVINWKPVRAMIVEKAEDYLFSSARVEDQRS
jgi:hypothetical protein